MVLGSGHYAMHGMLNENDVIYSAVIDSTKSRRVGGRGFNYISSYGSTVSDGCCSNSVLVVTVPWVQSGPKNRSIEFKVSCFDWLSV